MKDIKFHVVPLFTFCARGFKMAPSIVYVLPSRADHVKTHNAQSVLIHTSFVKTPFSICLILPFVFFTQSVMLKVYYCPKSK